jgi:ferrous iron transport protein A
MSVFPLNHFPSGSKVTISSFLGGNGARSRLYAMGLTPGTTIRITSSGGGPCRMKVRDSELVLGQGLAAKIMAYQSE